MFESLKKEYVVKIKIWEMLLEVLLEAIALSLLFYIGVTEYNQVIVDILVTISESNVAYEATQIIFPVFIIMGLMIKLGFNTIHDEKSYEEEKLIKIKNKKKTKKTKNTK